LEVSDDFTGTPQELYTALKAKADDMKIPPKAFPGSAAAMSRKLREVRPSLGALGWHLDFGKSDARDVTIKRINGENAVQRDRTAQSAAMETDGRDGMDGKNPTYSTLASDPWEEIDQ